MRRWPRPPLPSSAIFPPQRQRVADDAVQTLLENTREPRAVLFALKLAVADGDAFTGSRRSFHV